MTCGPDGLPSGPAVTLPAVKRAAAEAWATAHAAALTAGIELRPLRSPEDADLVRALVAEVWGDESMPRALVIAFQHAGAVLCGA